MCIFLRVLIILLAQAPRCAINTFLNIFCSFPLNWDECFKVVQSGTFYSEAAFKLNKIITESFSLLLPLLIIDSSQTTFFWQVDLAHWFASSRSYCVYLIVEWMNDAEKIESKAIFFSTIVGTCFYELKEKYFLLVMDLNSIIAYSSSASLAIVSFWLDCCWSNRDSSSAFLCLR